MSYIYANDFTDIIKLIKIGHCLQDSSLTSSLALCACNQTSDAMKPEPINCTYLKMLVKLIVLMRYLIKI